MRALKIVLIVFFALIVLVGGLMTATVFLINPNDYKSEIAEAVKKETGRELVMQGDISLSLFPWLGFEMDRVSLGNAPGFSDPVFARIGTAEVRIKIMPLLKKQVEVGTIVLDGLQVNLERKKNGTANWEDLAKTKKESPKSPETTPEPATKTETAGFALAALAIDGVRITDGAISWKDAQAGTRTTLDHLELTASQIALKSPFSLFFGCNVRQSAPALDARITLDGKANLDPEAGTYAFSNAVINLAGTGAALPGGTVDLKFTSDITADLPRQLLNLNNIILTTYGLNLTGEIKGTAITSSPQCTGKFNLARFNPQELFKALGQTLPETSDPSVLKTMQADLAFTAGQTTAELTSLNLILDQTTVQGTGAIKNFKSPAISFTVKADAINVDRYLPPAKKSAKSGNAAPAGSGTKPTTSTPPKNTQTAAVAIPLPLDLLRTLDLKGNMTLGKLTVSKLNLSDMVLQIKAKNGRVILDPMTANLYQGAFKGTTVLDVRGKVPALAVTEALSSMQVGPLLKDMTGKDTLTGTTQSTASLTTSGMTPDDLKANLNGNLNFTFTDGSIKGINLPKMLRDAVTRVKGGTPDTSEVNTTDFASLGGTATITRGVLDNQDLIMMSPLMRVNGAGTANIPKEGIDYLLKATVVSSLKGQQGEPLSELAGLTVPVRITGTFAQPKFKLDLASLFKDKGVQELKEKAIEKIFKGKDTQGIDPEKLLKGFFK